MRDFVFENGLICPQIEGLVMLIDDDEDDQMIFLSVMEKINPSLECVTAWNGLMALHRLQEMPHPPALIFLDLNMPLMNGQQFLRESLKIPRIRPIPIIVLSTTSDTSALRNTLREGASHYVTKPNDFSGWEHTLRPILGVRNTIPVTVKNKRL